jgi:poly(3-hydroxybutyrate) depolymerase
MSDSIVGKRVLVDVTEYDRDLRVRLRADCVGIIVAVTATMIRIQPDGTNEILELRAAPDALTPATPGSYQLRSGESIPAPDLIARWDHFDQVSGYAEVLLDYPNNPEDDSSSPAA